MKMSTIASPWRYDRATGSTSPCADARHGAVLLRPGRLEVDRGGLCRPCPIGCRRPRSVLSMAEWWKAVTTSDEPWMTHERIEINPEIMGGKPVIRGTRVPVEIVLRKLGAGLTAEA